MRRGRLRGNCRGARKRNGQPGGRRSTLWSWSHGFTADEAQSYASSLRRSWVREHLLAQETQNLGGRAFDAVRQWRLGQKGKPRFKTTTRGSAFVGGQGR